MFSLRLRPKGAILFFMRNTKTIQSRLHRFFQWTAGLALVATLANESAASEPIQLSLFPDIALHDRNTRIEGVSLGIWSENPQRALTLGIVNGSTGQSTGFSLGYLVNYSDSYTGVQWAPVNYSTGDYVGWQSGLVNYSENSMRGLQSGGVNYAGRLFGLQLGFINYAETVDQGVQIGLINLMPENAWFSGLPEELAPGMVFVNWRF